MAFEVDSTPSLSLDPGAIQRATETARLNLQSQANVIRDLLFLKGLPGLTPVQVQAFEDAYRDALDALVTLSKTYSRVSKELNAVQSMKSGVGE